MTGNLELALTTVWRSRLDEVLNRIDEIIAQGVDTASLHELVILNNNGEYLLLYAEASDHLDPNGLAEMRAAFYDTERTVRLDAALQVVQKTDAEAVRFALSRRPQARVRGVAMADSIGPHLEAAEASHRRFLESLGIDFSSSLTANDAYLRMVSSDLPTSTRCRISEAWAAHRTSVSADSVRAVEQVVRHRHSAAAEAGYASAAEATFSKAGITIAEARNFLDDFLSAAIEDRRHLDEEIAVELGEDHSTRDLPRLLRLRSMRTRAAVYDAHRVLDTAFQIAERSLDIEIAWVSGRRYELAEVFSNGVRRGELYIDRQRCGIEERREASRGDRVVPVAAILQVGRDDAQIPTMTSRAVQSMLHEFGHAMHHVLRTNSGPSVGGLDYAPLERLDSLSTWFEQWVQHQAIADCAVDAVAAEDGRYLIEVLQRRALIERGVYASFDLELHANPSRDAASIFHDLIARHGIDDLVLADILPYLTWPMQQRNPGGEVGILWGWASSAQSFERYRGLRVQDIDVPIDVLVDALDPARPSDPVSARIAMEFLRR